MRNFLSSDLKNYCQVQIKATNILLFYFATATKSKININLIKSFVLIV
jgi:hypothetical protein